jgi:hypothetical protein
VHTLALIRMLVSNAWKNKPDSSSGGHAQN